MIRKSKSRRSRRREEERGALGGEGRRRRRRGDYPALGPRTVSKRLKRILMLFIN